MNKKIFRVALNAGLLKTMLTEPNKTYRQLATEYGVGVSYVNEIAKANGISRPKGPKPGTVTKSMA